MPISPVVGAALIGGVSNLVGNIFGAGNNASTNKTNREIAQMNNEFNAREAEKNRQFQRDEWLRQFNLTNEYNTAAAQRQRLEDAGLNPYMMMNGGSSGIASAGSTPSGSMAQAAPPISMQAYKPDMSGFNTVADLLARRDLINNQALESQGRKNLNDAQSVYYASHTDWAKTDKKAQAKLREQGVTRAELGLSTEYQILDNLKFQGDVMRSQMALNLANADARTVMNKYLDQQQQAEIGMKVQLAYQALASGRLSEEQVRSEVAKQILTYAQANGQRISNRVADQTAQSLIDSTNSSNAYYGSYYGAKKSYARGQAATDYLQGFYDYKYKKQGSDAFWTDKGLQWMDNIGNRVGNFRSRGAGKFRPMTKVTPI